MSQDLFNIVVGVAGALAGFWLNQIWATVKENTKDISQLQNKVAGEYVPREEYKRISAELFAKIDKLNDIVHTKADRDRQ